ncbi:rhodanese-like domain-containing protein [Paenibacillus sp. Marseille-Q4541]|uniref:rhodanese-like domain-containing protein n=1 Tax=Paenibacillus sp. Marseille-Q4541 TaxID=2831522 RepID=UPI001BAD83EA|nr:rhodanese-like domain-containing protein [Paenibacillus sp. Marseille-Q4541]
MNQVPEITPAELKARLQSGEVIQLIDVREDEEVAAGMIPGAKHIPLGQIPNRLDEIEKTEETIFICRSGYRSERACEYLTDLGYPGCVNLVGGMIAWSE